MVGEERAPAPLPQQFPGAVGDEHAHRLVIGNVVCFHVAEALWQGDRIDPVGYASLGRIGGPLYVTRGETITARISPTIT